ncbi:sulfurtransferase complex subunit TusC [Aeromonas enteropelogenes]|uniref:sulfurtransferase complex subunit TusC n=1 Tax=Aeromonas enteropelogenes TaxID=29489 RepID=UPI002285D6DF|nr:sulfurtransferase complex subunit TusC [Aeromonas enteropelogenes]MCZ0753896.1 sulfurtransferase complex subunit TusC [Aeromonas enteropelogenes]
MTKKIAFICRRGPHGYAAGREGLDALLATSALTESVALFLIGDGVLQLVKEQQPAGILQRHYAPTFKMLELYDIEEVYVCADSLAERGLTLDDLLIQVESMPRKALARCWAQCSAHISF